MLGFESYALKENICWFYVKWHKNCVMCGGSGMFIPDPGSSFWLISDPRSKNTSKRQLSEENGLLKHFLYSQICQNYALILDFICWQKKDCTIFAELFNFLRKMSPRPQKVWIRYLGSGRNIFRIQDPGSGSATLVTVP